MKLLIKKTIIKALKIYKPIDIKLRKYNVYRVISVKLQLIYQTNMMPNNTSTPATYYVNNFDTTSVTDNTVLLDSFWGRKVGCHPYALYKALKVDPRTKNYKYIWVKNKDIAAPGEVSNDEDVCFVEHNSLDYAHALLTCKILISNSNFLPFFIPKEGQIVISTWHGIPMKTLGYDTQDSLHSSYNTQRNFNISTLIPMPSEYASSKTILSYGAKLGEAKKVILGSARIDLTINTRAIDLRSKLGINDNKKIVLYAPTWRGKIGKVNSEISEQIKIIGILEEELGNTHHIFVSLHHLTKAALKNNRLNISYIPEDVDTNEFLAVSDLLISDYSSIFIDYLILDKPIVLYTHDLDDYLAERGLYILPRELPVNIANTPDTLRTALSNLFPPSHFSNYNNIISTMLPYEDGAASARIVNQIFTTPQVSSFQKKKILIAAGGLHDNGITRSLLNLLSNIDYNLCEIHLLINSTLVQKDPNRLKNFNNIDPRCHKILTNAPTFFTKSERKAFRKSYLNERLSDIESTIVHEAFAKEARRLFGENSFHTSIDFSGYSPYWANLISATSAKNKIIYQHSDMLTEATNTHNLRANAQLYGVFNAYRYFNKVASVSNEVSNDNYKNLSSFYDNKTRNVIITNTILPKDIIDKSLILDESYASCERKYTFICVGRLSPEKGQDFLIESFKLATDKGLDANLLIVGTGPMLEYLTELSVKLGVKDSVIFMGHQNNPYNLIKNSDCFILPSQYEGQGLVLIEALTLGTPCIAADIPAARGILENDHHFLCERTVKCFADRMIEISTTKSRDINFDPYRYNEKAIHSFNKEAEII